jgi:hypothetical protein
MVSYHKVCAACSPYLNYSTEDDPLVHKNLTGKLQIGWGSGNGNPVFYLFSGGLLRKFNTKFERDPRRKN